MKKAYILCLFFFIILPLSHTAKGENLQNYLDQGLKKFNTSDFRGALDVWEQGLALALKMNHKNGVAAFTGNIGMVYTNLGDYTKALSYYAQALKIRREIGDKKGIGNNLGNIGVIYDHLGDYPKALSFYEQAIKIGMETGDKQGVANNLGNMGVIYKQLGDHIKALSYYEQAAKIKREIGDKQGVGVDLGNIGRIHRDLGNYPKALTYYEQALKMSREIGDKQRVGSRLGDIGTIHRNLGDYPKALSFYEQALEISKEIGDKSGEGTDLGNIGSVYFILGDYFKALSNHKQALIISREIGDKSGEGNDLMSIGLVYWKLGDYAKALSHYEQALNIKREVGEKPGEGYCLGNIGLVYKDTGDYTKALSYDEQALKIFRDIKDKQRLGVALGTIGIVYWNLGDYTKALSYHEQALKIRKEIGDKQGEGIDLGNIGLVYQDIGDYTRALSYHDLSLKIGREIGVPTGATEGNIGDTLMSQGKQAMAFEIFKRLKLPLRLGRYYLATKDYLKAREEFSHSLKIDEGVDMPNAELLLADYIGLGLAHEGLREYQKAKEYFKKGIEFIEKQRGALGGAERERFLEAKVMGFSRMEPYEGMVRVLMKEKGKGYEGQALSYVERAKSKTFLEQLANRDLHGRGEEDRAVLEKEKAFQQEVRVLRKRMEAMEKLGDRAPVGEMKRLGGEYEKKEAEFERFIKEVKLKNSELASMFNVSPAPVERIQSWLGPDTALLEYYTAKDKTYAWLVTQNTIRVYEVPLKEKDIINKVDEFLIPNISNRSRKAEPIITLAVGDESKKESSEVEREKNRQNFNQSASDFYRSLFAPVEKDIKTSKLIIVPHGVLHKVPFSALSDGRKYLIDKYAISVLPAASVLEFVVKKRKPGKDRLLTLANPKTDYVPLGFAEQEGRALAAMFPKNQTYYREKATETLVKNKASEFNIIHFATHGEFNDRQPMQSGLLLAKDDENDGYLQVHEIFGMDLKNANLVTLSACETALSKIQGGDDLVGLSRGFIYAGTPSILATLWQVDDASTAKLMELFYKNWNKGMSKPEALRQAQITLKAIPQYKHPFYWAPFEMIGDWR